MKFRTLYASEIECRVGQCKENGCTLLLYKDARVDMNLLDETVGCMNWKREHQLIDGNVYCTVSIWDDMKQQWVSKQDVGTEANTEKEKSRCSDSFKRSCFNIGIGRELYSAPFIWIPLSKDEVQGEKGRYYLSSRVNFSVSTIEYNDKREISKLIIVDKDGKERFSFGCKKTATKKAEPKPEPKQETTQEATNIAEELFSDTRMMAIQEVNAASTIDTLKGIWTNYKDLQSDQFFISAVNQRKAKLLNNGTN